MSVLANLIYDPAALLAIATILVLWIVFEIVNLWCDRQDTPPPRCPRCGSRWHTDCDEP